MDRKEKLLGHLQAYIDTLKSLPEEKVGDIEQSAEVGYHTVKSDYYVGAATKIPKGVRKYKISFEVLE